LFCSDSFVCARSCVGDGDETFDSECDGESAPLPPAPGSVRRPASATTQAQAQAQRQRQTTTEKKTELLSHAQLALKGPWTIVLFASPSSVYLLI
jgi:hypothetical protein